MHGALHMPRTMHEARKIRSSPKLSPLAYLEALFNQKVKVKAGRKKKGEREKTNNNACLSIKGMPGQVHNVPLQGLEDLWIQSISGRLCNH